MTGSSSSDEQPTSKQLSSSVKKAAALSVKATAGSVKKAAKSLRKGEEYTWDELQDIERRRRAILQLTEDPYWRILLHWDGTVLRILATDSLFWITVAIYIVVRVQARLGLPDYVADLGTGDIAIIGGFLSFFLVFYVVQSNSRFFDLYGKSMAAKGRIFDAATLSVIYLPKVTATRLIRYMNAAHVAAYTGLSSKYYSFRHFFTQLNNTLRLLTDEELDRLVNVDLDKGGSAYREIIVWCMKEVYQAHKEGLLDDETANQLRAQVLELRAAMGHLFNAKDLPIPFFYVHFICLLSALYLPLFAVSAAYNAGTGSDVYWTADVVAGLIVVLQAIFVIGLRLLGQKLSDPYGDDLVDLSVIHYSTFTWRMSNRILAAHYPEETTGEVEDRMRQERITIGPAWEEAMDQDEEDLNPTASSSDSEPWLNLRYPFQSRNSSG